MERRLQESQIRAHERSLTLSEHKYKAQTDAADAFGGSRAARGGAESQGMVRMHYPISGGAMYDAVLGYRSAAESSVRFEQSASASHTGGHQLSTADLSTTRVGDTTVHVLL